MSLVNKIITGGEKLASRTFSNTKPALRFDGFQTMGAHTKPSDTRTVNQLLQNIEYFAQRNPEVAQFKNELKSMDPKHLGLVSDICELANRTDMLPQNLDMKNLRSKDGKSLFSYLMKELPKASKKNPEALEFFKEVINQTDSSASKYFLADFARILEVPAAAKHLAAVKPLIKDIAEHTLTGGYLMNFVKEKNFMNFIKILVNPTSNPEKIGLLPKLMKVADKLHGDNVLYLDSFVKSKTPLMQVEENLKVIPQAAKMLAKEGKSINIVDFVNNNVNFARAKQNIDIESVKNGNVKLG